MENKTETRIHQKEKDRNKVVITKTDHIEAVKEKHIHEINQVIKVYIIRKKRKV